MLGANGQISESTNPELATAAIRGIHSLYKADWYNIAIEDEYYSTTILPISDGQSQSLGSLITLRDNTKLHHARGVIEY